MRPIARLAAVLFLVIVAPLGAQDLQIARLGQCLLESGAVLAPCDIGYRTLGTLSARRDNAILAPTWFTGTSRELVDFMSAGLVDTVSHYLIVVDALGNGVSTSPSNSPTQGGDGFPRISIGDMVETQHRLVTEVLGLESLYAVTGASMGGMQTFEWMVAHPDFFKKGVPLIGSPRLGAYDVALWETQLRVLDLYEDCRCDDAAAVLAGLGVLAGTSPVYQQRETDPRSVAAGMDAAAQATLRRPDGWTRDVASQLHAMIGLDVARRHRGDLAAAARSTRAELLSIVVASDHVVTPWSAIEFTELAGGRSIVIDNDGGHAGLFTPEAEEVYVTPMRRFLMRD